MQKLPNTPGNILRPTDVSLSAPPAPCEADPGTAIHVEGAAAHLEGQSIRSTGPLPELLDPARVDEYRQALIEEHQPVGPTEHAIVRELTRHTAALDLWGEALGAVQRQGARALPEFALLAGEDGFSLDDAILAGAMSRETVDRCEKHLRSHSRAFYRALGTLETLQARRKKLESGELVIPPNPFTTEAACEAHLADRFKTGKCRCPRCGDRKGSHIKSRHCWECAACGCQTGLRQATIMASSPIPLTQWFTAIWLLLCRPTITTAELVSTLGIARILTVRKMAGKIRAAMTVENAGELLAGLDAYQAECRAASPESSARQNSEPSAPKVRPR